MGQYYEVLAEDKDGKRTVYNRRVDGEYTAAKLMEHSWWRNPFCSALSATLVDNPRRIAWVGDYAEGGECEALGFNYDDVWGENVSTTGVSKSDFTLDSVRYLVNEDKRRYVDLAKYKDACRDDSGWVIHPIPLLTCIGNGRGGGDYHPAEGVSYEWVGTWAFDHIMLSNALPDGYEEIRPVFKE